MFVCFVSVCWNMCFRVWSVIIGYIKRNVVLKHIMYRNSQDLFPSGRVGSEDKTILDYPGFDSPLEYSKQDYHKEES